jgi:hypothetical protein
MIVVYLIGIVIAVARMPRHSRPATFVLIGCALLLASSVVSALAQAWMFTSASGSVATRGQVLMIVNFALTFVRAGGFVMLIVAAFVGRTEPEGSAFPVGQAAPGGPPVAQRFG